MFSSVRFSRSRHMGSVVVTGCSRGIGLELCKYYLAHGQEVFAVCRTSSPELAATDAKVIEGVDVATTAGLTTLQDALRGQMIELLINNAGVFGNNSLGDIDYDNVNYQFQVN